MSHPRVQTVELAGVLDRLPVLVAYWDHEARNRFATEAHVDWFGIEPQELYGKHISELLGPELYEESRPFIEGALAGEEQHFETRLTRPEPDGRVTSRSPSSRTGPTDGRGFVVMTTDITARVRAEEALQTASARWRCSRSASGSPRTSTTW